MRIVHKIQVKSTKNYAYAEAGNNDLDKNAGDVYFKDDWSPVTGTEAENFKKNDRGLKETYDNEEGGNYDFDKDAGDD